MLIAQSVSYSAAFIAGLLSFLSPCVLPLIPGYFSFITGMSLEELTEGDSKDLRARVFLSTLAFVLGFSVVFIMMGALASFLGGAILRYEEAVRIGGGVIIIILGIHISGIYRLRFLDVEKRMHLERKPVHILGTFMVGMAFAGGWSPCLGPLVGSILAIAATQGTVLKGVSLLATYSLGVAIPFLAISIFIHLMLPFVRRTTKFMKYVNAVGGVILITVGVLLITDKMKMLI